MGGNSDKKESELPYLDRFYSEVRRIGHKVLDFISRGYVSKLERDVANSTEREVALADRVVRLDNAHENEKREWEKRVGRQEAENERLVFRLRDAHKKIAEQGETIGKLEGKLATAEGDLVLVHLFLVVAVWLVVL